MSGAGNLRKYRKSQKAFLRSEERFQERSLEKGGPCRYEAGATDPGERSAFWELEPGYC
ncbi:hypothetical protein SBBP2_570079 [Burkholderiales bacterium]|nr:hypothetical protein SBBP2_570079 [Burkholderiales bacterium]